MNIKSSWLELMAVKSLLWFSFYVHCVSFYIFNKCLQNKCSSSKQDSNSFLSFENVVGSEMHRISVNIYSKVPTYEPVAILKIVYMYHKHLNLNAEDKGASQVLDWLFTEACQRAMQSTPFETSVCVIIYSTHV